MNASERYHGRNQTTYAPSPEALQVASGGTPDYHGPLGAAFDGLQTTAFDFGKLKLSIDDVHHAEQHTSDPPKFDVAGNLPTPAPAP